ncbi:MAG: serine O-acetyltransferase EpsC [Fimbriimonadaceae bacterium]
MGTEAAPSEETSLQGEFLSELEREHADCVIPCRLRSYSEGFARRLLALLFPQLAEPDKPKLDLKGELALLKLALQEMLEMVDYGSEEASDLADQFFLSLREVRSKALEDAEATYEHDPAAESLTEVIVAYPGFYASTIYRLAHELYALGVPLVPRLLTEFAHRETGIDIHPGARIGRSFVIDHGTGLVVGETADIGDHVALYQGVTIGALSVSKKLSKRKRHPTIQNNVIIYANATILGGKTVIGENTTVGGNAWITKSVPANSIVSNQNQISSKAQNS